jgi:hypothetical protein
MTAALRAEFLKLATTRLVAGMAGLAVALTALIGVLEAVTAGTGKGMAIPSLATAGGLRDNLASTGFALLAAALLGAVITSGEYRLKTATDTYTDQPGRGRVLAAKALAAAAAGAVLGIARYAGGTVIGSALLAAAGAGAGSLIRQQTGAIIAVVAWGLVIELVMGATVTAVGRFLPYTTAAMMAGDTNGGGMPQIPRGVTVLPYPAAIAVLAAGRGQPGTLARAVRQQDECVCRLGALACRAEHEGVEINLRDTVPDLRCELADADDARDCRLHVPGRQAAIPVQQARAPQAVERLAGQVRSERRAEKYPIGENLGHHAPQPAHDDGAKDPIAHHADDQFQSRRNHRLNQHTRLSRPGIQAGPQDRAGGRADLPVGRKMQVDRADVALVRDLRRFELDRNWQPDGAGGIHGCGGTGDNPELRNGDAVQPQQGGRVIEAECAASRQGVVDDGASTLAAGRLHGAPGLALAHGKQPGVTGHQGQRAHRPARIGVDRDAGLSKRAHRISATACPAHRERPFGCLVGRPDCLDQLRLECL